LGLRQSRLSQTNNRYYSSAYGRFLTPDPYFRGAITTPSAEPNPFNPFNLLSGSIGLIPALVAQLQELQGLLLPGAQPDDDGPLYAPQDSPRLTEPASWNRYSYVQDDPINDIDPTGQFSLCATLGVASIYTSTWGLMGYLGFAVFAGPVGAGLLVAAGVTFAAAGMFCMR
jgi:hypothetical protein